MRVARVLGLTAVDGADDAGDGPADGADGPASSLIELTAVQRRLLARLALTAPASVALDELADAVWPDGAPASARASLQNQVARLRAKCGDEVIRTTDGGYALGLPTDAELVRDAVRSAEERLCDGDAAGAFAVADRALAWRRGALCADLADHPLLDDARRQLAESCAALENLRLRAAVDSGRRAWSVPEAERLVAESPFDEDRWVLLIDALAASGRRGDALAAFDRARRLLITELGLEPGSALVAAEAAVLLQSGSDLVPAARPIVDRYDLIERVADELAVSSHVEVVGEPGIGKSTVLEGVCRLLRSRRRRVAVATCAAHPATALAALTDLVDELGGSLPAGLPPVVGFVELVAVAVQSNDGLVLVVDDVDRAGPTTRDALVAASALPGVALLVAAASPGSLGRDPAMSCVDVPPLGRGDLEALIRSSAGVTVSVDAIVDWLAAMSGGNPALLDCLLHDVDHLDELRRADGDIGVALATLDRPPHGGLGAPPNAPARTPLLAEMVRRRIAPLDVATRAAIDVAALCAPAADLELLEQLAPADAIAAAVAAGVLEVETVAHGADRSATRLRFRHGAVQRVVVDEMPVGERVEVHHRVATLLAGRGGPAPVVATHALEAKELDPLLAATWATTAAAHATSEGAHADAAAWYEAAAGAAAAAGELGRHARVAALVGRGDALRLAGSPQQEAALFEAADAAADLDDANLIGDAAFAVLQLGATTESGSMHERAIELADLALQRVTDPARHAKVAAAASLANSMTGRHQRCRELFDLAEGSATDPDVRRAVLPFTYLGLGHPRDLDRREALTWELLELGRVADDPVALFEGLQLEFSVALQRADGERLRRAVAESERLVDRVGDAGRRWSLAYQRAALAHIDDDLEQSEQLAADAMGLFAEVSPSRAFAAFGGQLLAIRIAQGREPELADSLRELIAEQPGVPAWHAALSLATCGADPDQARHHATIALGDVADDFTWLAAHLVAGRAAALLEDPELVGAYRRRLAPFSGLVCWQGTCSYGPVDTVLAQLAAAAGDAESARRYHGVALDRATSLGAAVFLRELQPPRSA